jgi:hypothetical protein
MKILSTILIIVALLLTILITFILIPFVNRFMIQVVFKSKKRTRKVLLDGYNFYQKKYPNVSEKELLLYTIQAAFCILKREEYSKKLYSTKSKSILTENDVNNIVEKAENIESLIEIVTEKGLSPDMAPWF